MEYRRLFTSALFVLFSVLSCNAPAEPAGPPDPIIGKWIYHGDDIVTFKPDGGAVSRQGGSGTWRFLKNPEAERKYEITWYDGLYIDTLKLSRDGKKLDGKNQKGRRIDGTRMTESTK